MSSGPRAGWGVRVWRALEISLSWSRVSGPRSASVGWPGRPESRVFAQPFSYGDAEQLDAVMRDAGLHAIDVQVSTMPIRLGANATDLLRILRLTGWQRDCGHGRSGAPDDAQEVMTALTPFVEAEISVIPATSHVVLHAGNAEVVTCVPYRSDLALVND